MRLLMCRGSDGPALAASINFSARLRLAGAFPIILCVQQADPARDRPVDVSLAPEFRTWHSAAMNVCEESATMPRWPGAMLELESEDPVADLRAFASAIAAPWGGLIGWDMQDFAAFFATTSDLRMASGTETGKHRATHATLEALAKLRVLGARRDNTQAVVAIIQSDRTIRLAETGEVVKTLRAEYMLEPDAFHLLLHHFTDEASKRCSAVRVSLIAGSLVRCPRPGDRSRTPDQPR